jgi:hypothetical protein
MNHSVAKNLRRAGILATAAGAAGLLSACGTTPAGSSGGATATTTVTVTATPPAGAGGSGSPTPTPPAGTSTPAGPAGCLASALKASLGPSNGTAGTIYYVVVFTNTSASACSLYGYPGVSFVTGQGGSTVGKPADRDTTLLSPTQVNLAPGGQAYALVGVVDTGALPPAACKPGEAQWLRVYAPGDTGALYVQFSSSVSVCTTPTEAFLKVSAVAAGADPSGS